MHGKTCSSHAITVPFKKRSAKCVLIGSVEQVIESPVEAPVLFILRSLYQTLHMVSICRERGKSKEADRHRDD